MAKAKRHRHKENKVAAAKDGAAPRVRPRITRDTARTSGKTGAAFYPVVARRQVVWMTALVVVTTIAYLPLLKGQFTNYDDGIYILDNPMIRTLDWQSVKNLFSSIYWNQYSPVAMLLMAVEFKFFGASPAALKIVSIVLHCANTVLVFELIRQLFDRFEYAIITAALFALSPLQVESVAWLTASMKIGAYALFTLASLLAYVYFLKQRKTGWFIASFLLFLLSCMSKEQAIALPASLLAIDYLLKRPLLSREVVLEKVPYVLVSLIFAVITFSLTGKMQNEQMVFYYTPVERLVFACWALATYLFKLVVPVGLSAFYTYPVKGAIPGYYYWTPLVAVLIGIALYVFWKREQRLIVFGILFFLANLFLTMLSQIMSVRDTMMADRYVYLPAIGFYLIAAYLIVKITATQPERRKVVLGAVVACALLFAVLSWQRAQVWENSITLFTDVIAKGQLEQGKYNPFLEMAFNNRGVARKQMGDRDGALADFNEATRLNDLDPKPWLNRANLQFDAGEFEAALKNYTKSLELDGKNATAYCGRGAAYGAQNKFDLAERDLNRAIELDPNLPDAYANRALLYANTKRFTEELGDIEKYLRIKPNDPEILNMRALALVELNRLSEAEADYDRAIQLNPRFGEFFLNRSRLYQRTGRKSQALQDAQRAQSLGISVDPQYLSSLR